MEPKLHEPVRTLLGVIGAPHAGHVAERTYHIYSQVAVEAIKGSFT